MERTDQPTPEPIPTAQTPQPNRILAEPATVAACQAEYEAAADVRAVMDKQQARHR